MPFDFYRSSRYMFSPAFGLTLEDLDMIKDHLVANGNFGESQQVVYTCRLTSNSSSRTGHSFEENNIFCLFPLYLSGFILFNIANSSAQLLHVDFCTAFNFFLTILRLSNATPS